MAAGTDHSDVASGKPASFSSSRIVVLNVPGRSGVGEWVATDCEVVKAGRTLSVANGVLATLASTDDYGMAFDFTVLTTTGELRFLTNPWLPIAGDNQIQWTPYDGEPETITVTSDGDAFIHQTRRHSNGLRKRSIFT